MRGLEYINEDKDRTPNRSKKTSAKKPSKKANHKHVYSIKKIIKDSWGSTLWEVQYLVCDICGKEKQETVYP